MKKTIFLFPLFFQAICLLGQNNYWQQQLRYHIEVSLDDSMHTLDGFLKLDYTNNSPDTLTYIWFHVWPNAFKNDQTAFADQQLENGSTEFYFSNREQRGYINRMDFRVNKQTARVEDHPEHIDIIRVLLPQPLLPGNSIEIETPFHVKIPQNFSRGGHLGKKYQITQWYPKPAVYDRNGWHPMPYLDQGEFYGEYGQYDVFITLPANYTVAASGELLTPSEKHRLATLNRYTRMGRSSEDGPALPPQDFPPGVQALKKLHYRLQQAHDFAWFADKDFKVLLDTMLLSSGRMIELGTFFLGDTSIWNAGPGYMKETIRSRSRWIGEYPYPVATVVEGGTGSGGMEYPTITLLAPIQNARMLEYLIGHELGHNWFYGILGTNERIYPWMDEGMNSYYDKRFQKEKYHGNGMLEMGSSSASLEDGERLLFETMVKIRKDQPVNLPSEKFSYLNYGLVAYYKASAWMQYLEKTMGREKFDLAMQEYFRRWQFKHPSPGDFKLVMEEFAQRSLDKEFQLLETTGKLPGDSYGGIKLINLFNPSSFTSYLQQPSRTAIVITPLAGFNAYDRFMPGVLFTNYFLPPPRLGFLLMPFYSTGARKLKGLARINFQHYFEDRRTMLDIFVNGSSFSNNEFIKENGEKDIFGFRKIVPGFRINRRDANPRSSRYYQFQWKGFFIREEGFRIRYDSIFTPPDTTLQQVVSRFSTNRNLHQVRITIGDNRVLYPYRGMVTLNQGKDFTRADFTGNYHFNYPKEGGLDLRLFAGKFLYHGSKTFSKQFATQRYHLNMTGPNGFEDFTYSDYFLGRNKFEGLASQQVMIRDGAFRSRTDLYANEVGLTDNWLGAVNLSTTIPSGLNPLSMFPVKIPLYAFLNIGTYADAWEQDSGLDRFLYEAGLEVRLFKDVLRVSLPIVYSPVFREYNQSVLEKKGRLLKTMSFSIDISNFHAGRINKDLVY